MKIEPTSPRSAAAARKVGTGAAHGTGSGEFAKALQDAAPSHGPQVSMSVGLTGLSTVLALQEALGFTVHRHGDTTREASGRGGLGDPPDGSDVLAGQEGLEPPTTGFGDRSSSS